jgi:4-amino-4-deoxy-L-arabinose transferase-like glycosyltransferase
LRRGRWAAAALLAAVASASALAFELRGRLPFTSDQGIISLMAVDILTKGVHPVFCYGAEYAGTLEPHYLALVFGLLSPSAAAFRLGTGLLFVLFVLAVAWVTRLAYGERAGFLAGLYCALGPAFLLYKGLTSDGAYVSLLLLLALCLGLLLRIEDRLAGAATGTAGAAPLEFGLLGLAAGLAWWVHPLAACLAPVVLVSCLKGRTRGWFTARALLPLLGGFLAGAFPWLWYNLRHGWASLHAAEMTATAGGPLRHGIDLFWRGLPNLLGARAVWRGTLTFPGAPAAALLLLAALLLFALASLRRTGSHLGRHAAALLLTLLVFVPILCLAVQRTNYKEPRYLLPLLLAVAPLAGALLAALWPRRALLALLAAVLLALGPGSELRATRFKNWERTRFESDPYQVIAGLRARGVDDVYASYWDAYRLAFLSGGQVAASPFGSGDSGLVRDAGLRDRLDRAPSPGFLLCCEDLDRLTHYLARSSIRYRIEPLAGFSLVTGLPAAALAQLRGCHCIPEVPEPGAIAWRWIDGPHRLAAGEAARYQVVFENRGRQPLSSNVHLSYHWRRLDGSMVQADGERTQIPPPPDDWWNRPWRKVAVQARVKADVSPGEYALVFDLVDETVAWFEGYGISPAPYRVAVAAVHP